jgi:hypothetical protein
MVQEIRSRILSQTNTLSEKQISILLNLARDYLDKGSIAVQHFYNRNQELMSGNHIRTPDELLRIVSTIIFKGFKLDRKKNTMELTTNDQEEPNEHPME